MTQPFYITTPIYYVNDVPHIGHAYTTIACDVMARFKRLDGHPVKFLTGTDEHGQKVEKAATKLGKSPQQFVDEVSQTFRTLMPKLAVSNDDFIRTTEDRHKKAVAALWQRLAERDQIYLGEYSGWYAVRDEAFYQESELVNGKAPTGADVEWVTEASYFFKLSAWQEPLLKFYHDHPDFILPESRRNEVLRFVEGGLHDLSVSRASFQWGIPVPNDPKHVIYVWLDALTNYMSALGYPDEKNPDYQAFWPEALHVVGKDILRFHSIYWPAFLLAAGLNPPKRIFAHGWWTIEGEKMSKSLGNAVDPVKVAETYGVDPLRYFLIREVPFGNDGDFSQSSLIARLNSDLANSYGNLVQRVLSFINKNCEEKIPSPGVYTEADQAMQIMGKNLLPALRNDIDHQALHKMCEQLWRVIFEANRYVDEQKPWSLKTSDPTRMHTILYVLVNVIHQLAILTQPLIPDASGKILDQLAIPADSRTFAHLKTLLTPGTALPTPVGVFPRFQEGGQAHAGG